MNFCVSKRAFEDAAGYDEALGPRGEKPELLKWRRPGGEEVDLAMHIAEAGYRVLYNPLMVATHLVENQSLTPLSIMRRALHVGHNRAILSRRSSKFANTNNYFVLRSVVAGLARALLNLPRRPYDSWRKFSFTVFVLVSVAVGWVVGNLDDVS